MTKFFIAVLITILLLPIYKRILIKVDSVQKNFKGMEIPISVGGFIILLEMLLVLTMNTFNNYDHLYILGSLLLITIIGTYDDLYGDSTIKGLRGHIRAFFTGRITSGFLKAAIGGIIALFLGWYFGNNVIERITNFLLILLMINALNLFDLRPGRAFKVFFILFSFLIFTTSFLQQDKIAPIIFGILLIVFFEDIRAHIMLGDSGSNLLGLHLGIWFSMYFPILGQWIIIFLLIGLHIYTERYSLSTLIEKHKILKKIDHWGRRGTV